MQARNSNILITGGAFTSIEDRSNGAWFQKLQQHVAPSAFHDSGERLDPPRCHPNTRVAILRRLMDWITGNKDPRTLLMWLHSAAGAGKSSTAQTFAERCYEHGLLLATFFCGRSDDSRNHPGRLFPTLAYQIACAVPEVRPALKETIDQDPLIFTRSLEVQAMSLIVRPLQGVHSLSTPGEERRYVPHLIIIDGLDECGDAEIHCAILDLIARVLQTPDISLKFLITSRPDLAITHKFNSRALATIHQRVSFHDKLSTDNDISRFLEDKFLEIKATHPLRELIPSHWPPPDAITTLIQKSSGQFVYAAIAMKYISSIYEKPTRGLDVILGLHAPQRGKPFAELDALYLHILQSARHKDEALRVIAAAILRPGFTNLNVSQRFLGLEKGDIQMFLGDLTGLFSIKFGTINVMHASFSDFIFDPSRSGSFHLDASCLHEKFAIELLQSYRIPVKGDKSPAHMNDLHSYNYVREMGILHHLPLAPPTAALRATILECSICVINFSNSAHPPGSSISSFIPRYLSVIRNLAFDDVEQIYADLLPSFDKLLTDFLDMFNTTPSSFFCAALLLPECRIHIGDPCMLQLFRCFQRPCREPLIAILHQGLQDGFLDMLVFFLNDPSRSQCHAMNDSKRTLAASYCLQLLIGNIKEPFIDLDSVIKDNYAIFLDILPSLLNKADRSEEMLQLSRQSFARYSLEYSHKSIRARLAINNYVSRVFGNSGTQQERGDQGNNHTARTMACIRHGVSSGSHLLPSLKARLINESVSASQRINTSRLEMQIQDRVLGALTKNIPAVSPVPISHPRWARCKFKILASTGHARVRYRPYPRNLSRARRAVNSSDTCL